MDIDSSNYTVLAYVDGGTAWLGSANALDNACITSVDRQPGPRFICRRVMVRIWAKCPLSGSPLDAPGNAWSLAIVGFNLEPQERDMRSSSMGTCLSLAAVPISYCVCGRLYLWPW